jgi:hypothetical protein
MNVRLFALFCARGKSLGFSPREAIRGQLCSLHSLGADELPAILKAAMGLTALPRKRDTGSASERLLRPGSSPRSSRAPRFKMSVLRVLSFLRPIKSDGSRFDCGDAKGREEPRGPTSVETRYSIVKSAKIPALNVTVAGITLKSRTIRFCPGGWRSADMIE